MPPAKATADSEGQVGQAAAFSAWVGEHWPAALSSANTTGAGGRGGEGYLAAEGGNGGNGGGLCSWVNSWP